MRFVEGGLAAVAYCSGSPGWVLRYVYVRVGLSGCPPRVSPFTSLSDVSGARAVLDSGAPYITAYINSDLAPAPLCR